jgi:hypothetical protein
MKGNELQKEADGTKVAEDEKQREFPYSYVAIEHNT